MSNINISKLLTSFCLIIFLLPFFNTCSKKEIVDEKKEKINVSSKFKNERNTSSETENSKLTYNNDDFILNAYEIALIPFKKFDKTMLTSASFYFSLCFLFQIISVFILFFLLIKNRIGPSNRLIITNIIVLLFSILIPLIDGTLKFVDQIKIGYYIYLLNLFILYYFVSKEKRKAIVI